MVESLINKILFLIFFLSILNGMRHVWKIFMILRDDNIPNKGSIQTDSTAGTDYMTMTDQINIYFTL